VHSYPTLPRLDEYQGLIVEYGQHGQRPPGAT
jgi:hypothetical protein